MSTESTTPRRTLRERKTPPRRGDERETALLAVAERLLGDESFDAASIADIAIDAGITRPTFYFYFASKQALLNSLLSRTMDEMTAGLSERLNDPGATPAEAMGGALKAVADLWFDHRPVMLAVTGISATEPAIFERIAKSNHSLTEISAHYFAAGRNVAGRAEARELAQMLIWMAERNFYVMAREQPTRKELHALADRLLGVWLDAAGLDRD